MKANELPPTVEMEAYLVPKPDRQMIDWYEDVEAYISTEAYSR